MDQDPKKPTDTKSSRSKISGKSSRISPRLSPPNIFETFAFSDGIEPVKASIVNEELQKAIEAYALRELNKPKKKKEKKVHPDMQVRVDVARPPDPVFPRPPYVKVETKKQIKEKLERRKRAEEDRNFCKWEDLNLPRPFDVSTIGTVMDVPSPDISRTGLKAIPRRPSISPSQGHPDTPTPSHLELRKPKSGIYINETRPPTIKEEKDSFDLVYERKPRPRRPGDLSDDEKGKKKKKKKHGESEEELVIAITNEDHFRKGKEGTTGESPGNDKHDPTAGKPGEKGEEDQEKKKSIVDTILEEAARLEMEGEGEGEDFIDESYLTKMFRRKVSQVSKATSLNSKELLEFPVFSEEDLEGQPYMHRIIQKFRRDSEAERYKTPRRKILHGTLESHSFTKLLQPMLKEFYFGVIMGTINQGDKHFGESTRDLQGICMPVAAYCYSMMLHPNKWTELIVDDVLEVGDKLFSDSIGNLHMHIQKKELEYYELHKYCFIEDKKIRFQVYEPEIVGLLRSTDKKVYNLYKGLKLFYNRHRAGILRSQGLNIVIWKDDHYYFFDAKGRQKDLVPDQKGMALLANMYDIPDICTVLLDYGTLENKPFTISKLSVFKIMDKNAPEEDIQHDLQERSDYNILDENKAVIQGSFDLADLCFDFSRNKQANAMAAVCLVYSRITPPSAWHKKTIDKIMIIGNQLYLEMVESENITEMSLEKLPAVFTVGPYVVEITIYLNVYADVMFRKGVCMLHKNLEKFFETNTMAITCVGRFTLAIWKQRNLYYCFDPYSRNNEALRCRNGNACISMNAKLETLVQTVGANFDSTDEIFYIHALKVLKIHRDPAQEQLFPKTMTMDEISPETLKTYKMKKSKKKAIDKTVTADFSEAAAKRMMPWDFLGPSLIEIGSAVESLTPDQMPTMVHKFPSRAMLRALLPEQVKAIDLDSPSLSDTQIEPDRPSPVKDEELDLSAWELTQEELELEGDGEDDEGEGGDKDMDTYMAMNQYAQVHADSLDSYHRKLSAEVNTDITVGFLPVPRDILPATNMRWKQQLLKDRELAKKREILMTEGYLVEPEITQSKELAKPSNFADLPDNTQLIRGTINIASLGSEIDYMGPFVCMMASAVAKKYDVTSWSGEIIDYTLRSGSKLYTLSKVRYDQVPILDVPKVSLGNSNYSILVEYLIDTIMKQSVLEEVLAKVLFKKHACGLVVTPSYACAVFFKNYLFYLFDCFGCNEVGLGEGPGNTGMACFARFKNIHDLTARIMYNKTKRDSVEEYEFTRFVLSSCTSKYIPPKPQKKPKKSKKSKAVDRGEDEGYEDQEKAIKEETEDKEPKPENRVGYQINDGVPTLQGSTAIKDRFKIDDVQLKEDHFVCICACLMLLNYPILKWDTRRVDHVIEQGKHIYAHAENLDRAKKRIVRNILIYKHFFDIIITAIEILDWKQNKMLQKGFAAIMSKRDYVLLQYPNCCYVIYKHNDYYHVFDPYPSLANGMQDDIEEGNAGWTMFKGIDGVVKRLKQQTLKDSERYMFYTFEVTSVRKAPKKMVLSQRWLEYELDEPLKPEQIGKPFHEKDSWLLKDPVPWSRIKALTVKDKLRGKKENMWNNWDIEYPRDLYSLLGTMHQTSDQFEEHVRGKQTLANLVVAIGMLEIYELSEWNSAIMDSILLYGNNYFLSCIELIKDEDHELVVEDLLTDCSIFPYNFEIVFSPVVEGTIFLMRAKQFNLYKALRLFLDNYECRYGIVCVDRGDGRQKRMVAFGKVREHEYFMYDCQARGPPMFLENKGVSYILRCKTFKRLLHVLVLTLRGGDFFIFEVDVDNFTAMN